jgi:hypothetical protein
VRITIDVMHMLPRRQFSPQMLFHKVSVNTHLLSIYHHGFVSVFWLFAGLKAHVRKLSQMLFGKARSGAVFGLFLPVSGHPKNVVAYNTRQICASVIPFFHAIAPYVTIAYSTTMKTKK